MKNNLEIGTPGTLRLLKVDVHSSGKTPTTPPNNVSSKIKQQQSTTNATAIAISKQMNSGSTTTTPITSPSLDYFYLKPPGEIGTGVVAVATTPNTLNRTAKVEIENPLFHKEDANVNSPPSSPCSTPSPQGKRVKYAKHVCCADTKAHGRAKLEPSSEKARFRRQASTLSTCSDKVMILGDVAIKEPQIIATTTHHSNNTKPHYNNNFKNQNQDNDLATFATASASLKTKTNGSTPNTAIAITTLSPTSCLSLDKSNSTKVVTHLQNPKIKNKYKKFRFSPFSKKALSPPLIETVAMTTASLSPQASPPKRCGPQFCTSFCSCSSSFHNKDNQLNKKDFVTIYDDDCTESAAPYLCKCTNNTITTTTTTNTKCTKKFTTYDNNFLRPPQPDLHHCHDQNNFNTTATSTDHIWNNIHHQQQVHVCM